MSKEMLTKAGKSNETAATGPRLSKEKSEHY
jgi:hypothetical protein